MASLRPSRNLLATATGLALTVAVLAVPVYAFTYFSAPVTVLERHGAPEPSTSADERRDLVRPLTDLEGDWPPLILSYHDVAPDPGPEDRYTVTPQQLTDQLAMLRAAGFTSITSEQLVRWLDGDGDLPPRPMLVTFDDGTSGLWRYADAVLEAHDVHGVVFVISDRIGQNRPYYLTHQEIDRLVRTGRWDVHSHTKAGHDRIPIDDDGTRQPFLINRAWIPGAQRIETRTEFEQRIRTDLVGSAADLVPYRTGEGSLFAYPYSAEIYPTNDPEAPVIAAGVVAEVFDVAMTNVLPDRLVSERDRRRRVLPRVEVFASTSTEDLFTRVAQAIPGRPGPVAPLAVPDDWTDSGGEPLAGVATSDVDQGSEQRDLATFDPISRSLTLDAQPGEYLAALHAPGRSTDWTDYRYTATVDGLDAGASGATGSMFALYGSEEQVQVAISDTFVRVLIGNDPDTRDVVASRALPAAGSREATIDVTSQRLVVFVEGVELIRMPLSANSTGGIAIAATNGTASFSSMRLEPATSAPPTPNPTDGFEVTSGDWEADSGRATTDSPVFRARSETTHGDVAMDLRFRIDSFVAGDEVHAWDGVHVGLRYLSPDDLYYVSMARRDGAVTIKRKTAGTYVTLAQGELPFTPDKWHDASVAVVDTPTGVTITLNVDGQPVLTADDDTAPIRDTGRVSVRSDNVQVGFEDLVVRDL